MRARENPTGLAFVLAAVGGAVDAIGFVTLFHVFTAHMTGNTVAAAADTATASSIHEALRRAFPIPLFVGGVVGGALIGRWSARVLDARLAAPLLVEAALLGAFGLAAPSVRLGAGAAAVTPAYFAVVATIAFAMGVQATTVRHVGDLSVRTTFVTGALTVFGEQLVAWRTATRAARRAKAGARARVVLGVWTSYASGAAIAAAATTRLGFGAIILPLGGVAVALAIVSRRAVRRFAVTRGT